MILENHLHFIAWSAQLDESVRRFKSFTARQILDYLRAKGVSRLLGRMHFAKQAHKSDREYQFWQEGAYAELIRSDAMMREKLEYIHGNPVKRGYVDKPVCRRYCSARDYAGDTGLIEIDRWW